MLGMGKYRLGIPGQQVSDKFPWWSLALEITDKPSKSSLPIVAKASAFSLWSVEAVA